jgi:hypothetical protein
MYKVWFVFALSLGLVRAQLIIEYRNWPWPGIDGEHQNFYQSSMFFNREEETSTNKPSFEGPLEDSLEVNPTLSGRIRENNPSTSEQSVSSDGVRATATTIQKQTPINLEYKPTRPFYHPNPGNTVGQIIPPGKPWPSSPQDYQNFTQNGQSIDLINRIKEDDLSTTNKPVSSAKPKPTSSSIQEQTPISLEYQPNRPSFHPNPGSTLGQIVPPGKPWPSNAEDYQNFSQTAPPVNLEDRVKETSSSTNQPTTLVPTQSPMIEQTPASLEYKPNRPFHHPNPGNTVEQIVPPGQPWPSNAEDYQNFSQTAPTVSLEDRIKESNISTTNRPISSTVISPTPSPTKQQNLEYQPNRPSYHPNPGNTIGQIVPPGKPWPSNAEDYKNFSQTAPPVNLEDRIKETSSTANQPTLSPTKHQTPISLEYKPNRPFYHPNPGNTVGQVVPPGKPWPGNVEDYQNFSQPAPVTNLEDRIKEPGASTNRPSSSIEVASTPVNLEYKPSRPSHHPNPGSTLGQIVPPGKPWPNSTNLFENFNQTTALPNVEISSTPKKPESAPSGFWWPAVPSLEDSEQKEQPRSSSIQPDALETTSRNEEITNEGKLYTSKIRVAESTSEGTPVTTPRGKIA